MPACTRKTPQDRKKTGRGEGMTRGLGTREMPLAVTTVTKQQWNGDLTENGNSGLSHVGKPERKH